MFHVNEIMSCDFFTHMKIHTHQTAAAWNYSHMKLHPHQTTATSNCSHIKQPNILLEAWNSLISHLNMFILYYCTNYDTCICLSQQEARCMWVKSILTHELIWWDVLWRSHHSSTSTLFNDISKCNAFLRDSSNWQQQHAQMIRFTCVHRIILLCIEMRRINGIRGESMAFQKN